MKKVILYGAGLAAEKFYWKYKNQYKVLYYIDKKNNRNFHQIPVYSLEEKTEELKEKKYFVIVTTETKSVYDEIATNLKQLGLDEFIDFISIFELNKDLAILYGNCHLSVMENYLRNTHDFNSKFAIRYFYVANIDISKRSPSEAELCRCKLLIAQDIRENNSVNAPSLEKIKGILSSNKECKIITIPNLYGVNLYFPQVSKLDGKLWLEHKNKQLTARENNILKWIIGWKDNFIEKSITEGFSCSNIVKKIESEKIFSDKEIKELFNNGIEKIKNREKKCDIIISDYILDNYKEIQLFYDPNHPTNELIIEKSKRILKLLKIEIDKSVPVNIAMDCGELFLYDCVKKSLGLKFNQKYIRKYQYNCTLSNKSLDLAAYVEEYFYQRK